ncbi:MAG: hypothetical protein ACI3XQ_06520 [Eubacteriales bacterium]
MPRLVKSKAERQYSKLVGAVRIYMLERRDCGENCHDAALRLGMPYERLNGRLKKPGDFTLRELQAIANVMNVSIPALIGEGNDQ